MSTKKPAFTAQIRDAEIASAEIATLNAEAALERQRIELDALRRLQEIDEEEERLNEHRK